MSQYIDSNLICRDCNSNCKTCSSSSTTCTSCFPGSVVKSDNTCGCDGDCATCDANGCLSCNPGFTLNGSSCDSLGSTDCDLSANEWKKIVINNPLRKLLILIIFLIFSNILKIFGEILFLSTTKI